MAVSENAGAVTEASKTPYQLDLNQVLKASQTLLRYIETQKDRLDKASTKRNLLDTEGSESDEGDGYNEDRIWLNLTTKQHIVDKNRLKPSKIPLPHSLNTSEDLTICLITTDPQRVVKNAIAEPTFPSTLSTQITKVIGIQKLAARYKSFESRRQLLSEHDIFLADDRIITRLPGLLGKAFYKSTTKRPIPISIAPRSDQSRKTEGKQARKKGESHGAEVASSTVVAAEISRALGCAPISLRPGLNVSVRVGLPSFNAQQLKDNVATVVPKLIEKHVVKGWRNVKSIHIKSQTSLAIPIWLSESLWTEDDHIDANDETVSSALEDKQSTLAQKRKRNPATAQGPQTGQRKKAKQELDQSTGKLHNERRIKRLTEQKSNLFNTEV